MLRRRNIYISHTTPSSTFNGIPTMFKPKAAAVRQVVVPAKASDQKKPIPKRPASLTSAAQRIVQDKTRAKSPLNPTTNGHANGVSRNAPPTKQRHNTSSLKRKRTGTPQTPDWAEDDDEEDADLEETSKKRQTRPDNLEPDLQRAIWLKDTIEEAINNEQPGTKEFGSLIHAADFTSGKTAAITGITADIYKSHFELADGEDIPVVELQYPGGKERFQLVYPDDNKEYRPMMDIFEAVEAIIAHYFPSQLQEKLLHEETGFPRRLKIAVNHRRLDEFRSTLAEFNELVKQSLTDGTIHDHLDKQHTVPIALIERILEHQSYERTVAPHSAKLKVRKEELKNEKSKTYGEIKPRFAHDIFRETKLRSGQVFIDLGSGVGNVVLQAALETGAEAHGIEIVDMPAQCATAQQAEFEARCRLWGIQPGSIAVHHGDFLTSPEVDAALKRADVVLVNNRVFEPWLNDALVLKFLDLKEGCKVVSLESFVPEKWEMKASNMHDVRNMLRTREMWYGADRVSWAYEGGHWYIATKDSSAVRNFAARHS